MEEKQKLTEGMIVTIPSNLKYTKEKYGFSKPMLELIGSSQKIEELIEGDDFFIKKWLWSKEDFEIPEIKYPIEVPQEIENISEISESRKILVKDLINKGL